MAVARALLVSGVTCRRGGRPVLQAVTLHVQAGEGVGLLGPNGAGKSTLARLTVGLERLAAGQVLSAGLDVAGHAPEAFAGRVGYLFQRPEDQLFARTVADEVGFTPRQLGWSAADTASAVGAALDALELGDVAGEHPLDLPRPRRRLVALASALVCAPPLVVLDEPTSGLDRRSRALVVAAVRAARARGAGVLAATHDPAFIVEALDRAVVLSAGAVLADAPLADLLGPGGAAGLPLPEPAALLRALGQAGPLATFDEAAAWLAVRCRPDSGGPILGHPTA